jgi:hypothetical protein
LPKPISLHLHSLFRSEFLGYTFKFYVLVTEGGKIMPMPLRPHSPMQRGMNPRMMPPSGYYGGMPYAQYHHPSQMPGPMMGRNPGQMMGRNQGSKGGGLLAKILGRGNQKGGNFSGAVPTMSRATSSGSGGLLQTLTNPQTLNGFLNNTQTILKTAQQLGPVIQQYGPIVRNLPSLWKLYRGLKEATSDTTENSEASQSESIESSNEMEEIDEMVEVKQTELNTNKKTPVSSASKIKKNNQSKPKLYI